MYMYIYTHTYICICIYRYPHIYTRKYETRMMSDFILKQK